jgi:hypothetical protein
VKQITVIALCIAVNFTYARLAVAGERPQVGSTAGSLESAISRDELHFVSVLRFQGEIVAVDPAKRLMTVKGPKGELLTLEARSEEDLAGRKVGERVLVRYFEGAHLGKRGLGGVIPVHSLKDGMIGAEPTERPGKQPALAASVERVDSANQEITLKAPDGSLETIMVSNAHYLSHLKVGDRVVITRPQALALSLEKEK